MTQTMVNFRMDADLKSKMETLCKELGLTMTVAFTIFAKKMTRENRIPFDVSYDPFYSESNQHHIQLAKEEVQTGYVVTKTMEELEAMAK